MNKALFRDAAQCVRARMLGVALASSLGATSPALAASAVPEPVSVSPFKQYQSWRDEPLQDWRAANDRVGEVGGWRTYLRESQPEGGTGQDAQGHQGHHGH